MPVSELALGCTLRLPGQMILPDTPEWTTPTTYVHRLRAHMRQFQPAMTRKQFPRTYVPDSLKSVSHVFVRVDGYKPPLTPPYRGPFLVLKRNDKYFTVEIAGQPCTISIDRLKPAFIENTAIDATFPAPQQPQVMSYPAQQPIPLPKPPAPSAQKILRFLLCFS